jgi:molybdenum cofactor cytidylyltransferase
MRSLDVAALILCAGQSSRMGQVKARLKWKGKTFLNHTIDSVRAAGITKILGVTGCEKILVEDELSRNKVASVWNSTWPQGMGSSIKVGQNAILKAWPDTSGILIVVCDQPHISGQNLESLIATGGLFPEKIIAAGYDGSFGVPVLFPKCYFNELATIDDSTGAKVMIQKNFNHTVTIPIPEAALDIDTPYDMKTLDTFEMGSSS